MSPAAFSAVIRKPFMSQIWLNGLLHAALDCRGFERPWCPLKCSIISLAHNGSKRVECMRSKTSYKRPEAGQEIRTGVIVLQQCERQTI